MPLPFGIPGSEDLPEWLQGAQYQTPTQALDPNEIAALRQRNAVRPPLGRQEGAATQFVEDTFGLPKTPLDAGLMALGGPFGKGTKALALGLGGLLSSGGEAEAGPLAAVKKAIKAYHGSPHDFDRFDLSKIGTGEGAQMYGHGLYFAEEPAVAKQYRDTLTRRGINDAGIDPAVAGGAVFDIAAKSGDLISGKIPFGPTRSLLTRDQIVDGFAQGKYSPFDLPPAMQRQIVDHIKPPGHMYEVNINAAPEQFLDWDKPLAQMSPDIQKKLADAWLAHPEAHARQTGAQIYGNTALDKWNLQPTPGPRPEHSLATDALCDLGIPGIKYLDQGSRLHPAALPDTPMANEARQFLDAAKGDSNAALKLFRESNPIERYGTTERDEIQRILKAAESRPTSNYVLFRDDIIDILRKYGLAGLAPAAGAAGMAGQDAQLPLAMPQSQ